LPRRFTKFVKGNYYHVYHRGADKQKIFYESENYLYFLRLLKKYSGEFQITVIAHCLMPNHFHLLVRVDGEKDLSKFVSTVLNTYVQALNKRYHRSGSLFAERFKSIHVDKDNYLIHLCRYIHLNPLKASLVKELQDWSFSNYLEFVGLRQGKLFEREFFAAYFANPDVYREFVANYKVPPPEDLEKYMLISINPRRLEACTYGHSFKRQNHFLTFINHKWTQTNHY